MLAIRARFALVASTALIAACSESPSSPKPSSASSVPDVATLLGEISPSELTAATSIASPQAAAVAALPAFALANCAYDAGSGFFVCPPLTSHGFTVSREYRLIDDAGNSQAAPSIRTVAIETKTSMQGTLPPDVTGLTIGSPSVTRSEDMTLSGIQTHQHTLNGAAQSTMVATLTSWQGTEPVQMTYIEADTTSNLVLPAAGQRWPQSGTITSVQSTKTQFSPAITTRIQVTFNGTSTVTIATTNGPVTVTCKLDLLSFLRTCS